MGNNPKALTSKNLVSFLDEANAVLQRLQPELIAQILEEKICISGNIICSGDDGAFDSFEIAAILPVGFPQAEPFVWETGGRIPRVADRHVYPNPGNCCLCVWQEWLWQVQCPSFESFLVGPLHSYFVSQSIFEMTGKWPFGERGHDKVGLDQALGSMLEVIPNVQMDKALALLSQLKIKGHARCPCGSGKRLRSCHFDEFLFLQERLPAGSWCELKRQRLSYKDH